MTRSIRRSTGDISVSMSKELMSFRMREKRVSRSGAPLPSPANPRRRETVSFFTISGVSPYGYPSAKV